MSIIKVWSNKSFVYGINVEPDRPIASLTCFSTLLRWSLNVKCNTKMLLRKGL